MSVKCHRIYFMSLTDHKKGQKKIIMGIFFNWLEVILDSSTNSMDMNLSKVWDIVEDRGAWCAAVHEVAKSRTVVSDWTMAVLLSNNFRHKDTLQLYYNENILLFNCFQELECVRAGWQKLDLPLRTPWTIRIQSCLGLLTESSALSVLLLPDFLLNLAQHDLATIKINVCSFLAVIEGWPAQ